MAIEDLLFILKESAIQAQDNTNPMGVYVGEVLQSTPLQIQIDDFIILQKDQLLLSRQVTEFHTDITVNHQVDSTYLSCCQRSHDHHYTGRKTFLHHHNLLLGETVILLRMQGGQMFVVMDRLA